MIHRDESAMAAEGAAHTHAQPESESYNDITKQRRGSLSEPGIRAKGREKGKKSIPLSFNGNQMHGLPP